MPIVPVHIGVWFNNNLFDTKSDKLKIHIDVFYGFYVTFWLIFHHIVISLLATFPRWIIEQACCIVPTNKLASSKKLKGSSWIMKENMKWQVGVCKLLV